MKNNSQDFYNERMRELAKFGAKVSKNSESNQRTLIGESVRSLDGTAYGIVKENHKYIIKKSTSQKESLCESDFSYINGVQNKVDYTYSSVGDAEKNLNMMILTINEAYNPNSTSKQTKEFINEDVNVIKSNNENSLNFISSLISNNKKVVNENWSNKFKDAVKKHSVQGKQQIIGEDVATNLCKTMNMINEDVQTGNEQEDGVDTEIDKAIDALNNLESKTPEESETPVAEPQKQPVSDEAPIEEPQQETPTNGEASISQTETNDVEDLTTDNTSDVEGDSVETSDETTPDAPISDTEQSEDNGEDAALTKEIEKLVGKLTYDVRKANLTPEETNSFLKSILASFEGELSNLDPNQKKELTKKIMSDEAESTEEIQTEDVDVESDENEECGECGTFDTYSKSLGYDNINEASPIEKGYVISGYIDGYKNGKNDGDFASIAKHLTPDVVNELAEYGHDDYIKEAEIYGIGQEDDLESEGGDSEEIENELECEGCDSQVSEEANDIKDFNSLSDDEKTEAFQMYLQKKAGLTENKKEDVGFAKTETMGVVKPNTTNTNTKMKDDSINEGKLKEFIFNVLKECATGKKSVINESKIKQHPNLLKVEAYVKDQYAKKMNKK